MTLKPENPGWLNTLGKLLLANGRYEEASTYLRRQVQILIGIDDWEAGMREGVKPVSAKHPVVEHLLTLITAQQGAMNIPATDLSYRMLLLLQPHNADIHSTYSTWAFSKGLLKQGINAAMRDVTLQVIYIVHSHHK